MRKKSRPNRPTLAPVYELIFELGKLFDSECGVCLKKMRKPMSGFTIHHLEYRPKEKTYKDFAERIDYYKYLKPIIINNLTRSGRKNPTSSVKPDHIRFAFLCIACHHSIDGPRGLKRRKRANVLRLFLMYFRTKT